MGNRIVLSLRKRSTCCFHKDDEEETVLREVKLDDKNFSEKGAGFNFDHYEANNIVQEKHRVKKRTRPGVRVSSEGFSSGDVCGSTRKTGRIKVVLTKHQLRELLKNALTMEDVISQIRSKGSRGTSSMRMDSNLWKPELETIPEGSVSELACKIVDH